MGFFKAYHNFKFQLITEHNHIIKHYLITQFIFDLIQAIPFFSYMSYFCTKSDYYLNCSQFNMKNINLLFILCLLLKQLKLFKVLNIRKNTIFYKFKIIIGKNDFIEQLYKFFIYTIICIYAFYFFISIHIFIGKNSYPNWIIKSNYHNKSLTSLYLISFYYLITTMTTVGYGDIVCASFNEIIYQIILLSVGLIIYSFIVSSIGNYVNNESHASMKFDRDEAILEDIRISYPNLPYKLYKRIFHHLTARKIRQQHCDSNILINSLPYSLKNQVLLTIYQQIIHNFKIFRGIKNTDYTLRLLKNLIPLFSKKNALLIREGQKIENIIFVKEGRLSLEASINIEEPGKSVMLYLTKNFDDINEDVIIESNYDTSLGASKVAKKNYKNYINKAKNQLETVINYKSKTNIYSSINESNIEKELGKWDYGGEFFEEINYQYINIINISKNESYGSVYMFLVKPSPLSLRVKSKKAELLLLRKSDAFDISKRYPNIWAKYYKKSYTNMLSIKSITIHKIKHYWKNLGKELFNKKRLKKERKEILTTIENKIEIKEKEEKEEQNNIYTIYNDCNIVNDEIEKKETKDIKKNKLSLDNKFSQGTLINKANYISFTNTDNKYISFGKDTNIINKKSFRNTKNKMKSRKSFCPSMSNHFLNDQNKRLSSQSNTFKSKVNTFNKFNSIVFPYSNIKSNTCISSNKQISTQVNKKSIQNLRIEYLKKLKRKIKYLKKSKKYYKDLCKKNFGLSDIKLKKSNSFVSFDSKQLKENNSPNNKKTESNNDNDNNKIIPDMSTNSNELSSFSRTRIFNSECISIDIQINFTVNSKYKNLDEYTLGLYSKNRYLRKSTLKFLKYYISNLSKRKIEKNYETLFSSIKSLNTSFIEKELSPSSLYSQEIKSNNNNINYNDIYNSNYNSNKYKKKRTVSYSPKKKEINLNEKQYLILYDAIKNTFDFIKKRQNSSRRSRIKNYSNQLTYYSHDIYIQKKKNNENNASKKHVKSLFSINKLSKKDILKNDDTILEWENELKNSKN